LASSADYNYARNRDFFFARAVYESQSNQQLIAHPVIALISLKKRVCRVSRTNRDAAFSLRNAKSEIPQDADCQKLRQAL
jgi:hypothetical protein